MINRLIGKKGKILVLVVLMLGGISVSAQLRIDRYLINGRQQLARSEFNEALSTFNQIIRLQEDNWEAWYYRGLTKYNLGDQGGAEGDFDKAISLQPNLAELYLYRGIMQDYRGEHYGALKDFNTGIELKPDDAVLHYSRGTTYLRLNNFSRAIEDFNIAVKKDPRMDEAFLNRGIAKAKMLNREKAFLDFNEAIMLNPFSGEGHQRKGLLYYETGNFQEALVSFSEAIQRDSTNTQSFYARALTWYEVERKDSCLTDLDRVIKLSPRHAAAIYNRALVRAQMEDYDGAISDYNMVNILYPNHVLTYFNRGIVYHQKGDKKESLADLSEAIRLYPDFAKAYLARASVFSSMGRREEALDDQKMAQEKILANHGKSKDELALNYSDTTIRFEELISLNSNFMKSFSSLVQNVEDDELDPVGFIKLNSSGELCFGGNKIPEYHQVNINLKYPDFDPEVLRDFTGLIESERYSSEKRFNDAIELLSEKIEVNDMKGPSLLLRANLRLEMIQFVLQTGVINEVVPLQIGKGQAFGTGDLSKQVDYSEVEADYTELIRICPEMPGAWFNRALIRLYSNDFAGSEKDLSYAIELDDQFAEAWYNRGIVRLYAKEKNLKLQGDKNDGCLDFSRAGELGLGKAYGVIKKMCGKDI